MSRPSFVMRPSESVAPSVLSVAAARISDSVGGFSKRSRESSETPAAESQSRICEMSSREISDGVYFSKYSSSPFRQSLTTRPAAVLPARPARCVALARLMRSHSRVLTPLFGSKRATRASPESMTKRTPSIVSDVSATFVATITLRLPVSARILSCRSGGKSP